jgi:hypothetical protein
LAIGVFSVVLGGRRLTRADGAAPLSNWPRLRPTAETFIVAFSPCFSYNAK